MDEEQQNEFEGNSAIAALKKGLGGAYAERQQSVHEAAASLLSPAFILSKPANHGSVQPVTDVWRESDNALRIAIYKVFKLVSHSLSTHRHNIAGIVKRVKVVMISNDPIARALTLRLYGLLAHAIDDNIDVHHSIIESLESSDPLEYNAAIFATDKSAKTSMFLMEIVQKIAQSSELLILACLDNLNSIAQSASHHFQNSDVKTLCRTPRFAQLLFTPGTEAFVSPVHVFNAIVKTNEGSIHACEFFQMSLEYVSDEQRKQEALQKIYELFPTLNTMEEIDILLQCFLNISCTGSIHEHLETRILTLMESAKLAEVISKLLPNLYLKTIRHPFAISGARLVEKVTQGLPQVDTKTRMKLLKQSLRFRDPRQISLNPSLIDSVNTLLTSETQWHVYQVAQSAMIGGRFELAQGLLKDCLETTLSESTNQWLQILLFISQAEFQIFHDDATITDFQSSLGKYQTSLLLLKGLASPRLFCQHWISLRILSIRACISLELGAVRGGIVDSANFHTRLVDKLSRDALVLEKSFPDLDCQSVLAVQWFRDVFPIQQLQGRKGVDANGDQIMEEDNEGTSNRLGGLMLPSYFFVVNRRCMLDVKIVPPVKEEEVVDSGNGSRISFALEGNVVIDEQWREHGLKMRHHQVCVKVEPTIYRNSRGGSRNAETRQVGLFKSKLKDGYFETYCSIEVSGWGGAGKYRLIVENQLVDFHGDVWHVGPTTFISVCVN
ncbi:UNVERIFIED_CONTAM: Integrator complex subunit 7 [Siphonaria sp. JEL0065]|nr:Integrator complex subunit 7 [Siphonaria sp. JEL0065]